MKTKGFTLIELLAVIVILAIIALIATPIILGIIDDSKKESSDRSVENYAAAVTNAIASYQVKENKEVEAGKYTTTNGKTLINRETTLKVDYEGNVVCNTIQVYEDGNIYLADCTVNGTEIAKTYGIKQTLPPVSFAEDSWETIVANVKAGNLSKYKVGDTKEIAITGYTNTEADSNGLYTIRIANTSTPKECSTEGFSQSACGFVIEFVDIITTHNMNPSTEENPEGTNVGGWPASEMYKILNDTMDETITSIYESLPEDLQKVIKPTQVVSGHGSKDSSNFTSTDKLYLLSTKEVYGKEGTTKVITNDTAEVETRQLDYYKDYKNSNGNIGVTTSNYSGAIKTYNGTATTWWLRSAWSNNTYYFYRVTTGGDWSRYSASITHGVAPAFRIG